MKNILLVCDRANIDRPLRRSLGHLVNSCQVEVVSDGFEALHELAKRAYNLIIVDFEISGVDSLELLESVTYIDPGVPVILMLKKEHRTLWNDVRTLMAEPILRPFKPISFLRLVDTLLHQHLERYRDLSQIMTATLDSLGNQVGVEFAFLADNTGTVLLSTGQMSDEQRAALGHLAAAQFATEPLPVASHALPVVCSPAEKDHDLLAANILDNLVLALVAGSSRAQSPAEHLPQAMQAAAQNILLAIQDNVFATPGSPPAMAETPAEPAPVTIALVPLRFNRRDVTSPMDRHQSAAPNEEVNWQILSGNAAVLNRLQNILSN